MVFSPGIGGPSALGWASDALLVGTLLTLCATVAVRIANFVNPMVPQISPSLSRFPQGEKVMEKISAMTDSRNFLGYRPSRNGKSTCGTP